MGFKNCNPVRRHPAMQPKSMYLLSIIISPLLLLLTQIQFTDAADVIKVGGLFDSSDPHLEITFRLAVDAINKDGSLMPNTRLATKIANVPNNDSFRASRKVCSFIKSGVGAIFSPRSSKASGQVESICETLEIPHIKTTPDFSYTGDEYSINLYPHASTLGKAYSEVLKSLGWKQVCIIYENNNGLIRVQEIMKDEHFDASLKQLPSSDDYRSIFKKVREDGVRNIVLDVSGENLHTVLKQAQQVGMVTDYHSYFITSLDFSTIDVSEFIFGGANIFSLQLVDTNDPKVQQVLQDLRDDTGNYIKAIQTEVALMYDAVQMFSKAVDSLSRSVNIDVTPLECDGDATWGNGVALNNHMKMVQMNGLTGLIKFDADGYRSDVALAVVKITKDGLKRIGSWDQTTGVNLTRTDADIQEVIKESLKDKTLVVSFALQDPYIMLSKYSEQLSGNDRYEGFCIDLLQVLSERLGFNYTLVRTTDDIYGRLDQETNQWTGLIGELLNLRADLAISSLTITEQRSKVVDFTIPWMNTGISMLYVKPEMRSPNSFIFLAPFSLEVWIYLALTYLGVSAIIFALARLSPYEKVSELSTLEDNHAKMGNPFSWDNSLWFTTGSLLQQRTYQQPRAASTRIVAFMWWFFVMILICSYTAGLVTIFQVGFEGRMESPVESVEDLLQQTQIKYGTVKGGSTHNFFINSRISTYQKLSVQMVNANTYKEGLERVQKDDGGYAFFMESTSIEYVTERICNLRQVGRLLDSKSYGIALPPGSPYRELINMALLRMQEDGLLHKLKNKWWTENRGGGWCNTGPTFRRQYVELGADHLSGVFIILLIGVAFATLVAIAEFLWNYRKRQAQ